MARIAVLAATTAALTLAAASPASAQIAVIPLDGLATLGGVEAACTGIGVESREDPRWLAYPVRVETSNAANEYLTGAVISVADDRGSPVLETACDGPWLLLKLPPGKYRVFARLPGTEAKRRTALVTAPATGQVRVVLQFLDQ